MKKIISIFQIISVVIGLIVTILFLIPTIIGIKPFIVLSGSMEPEIQTGAIAYVNSHVKPEEIKVGDIIGFKIQNGQATHRVIQINEDKTFITKGDCNETEDVTPVTYDTYKGKTVFSIPYIGNIISKAKTKQGVFAVTVFVGLNLLCVIFDRFIYEEDDDDYNNVGANKVAKASKKDKEINEFSKNEKVTDTDSDKKKEKKGRRFK